MAVQPEADDSLDTRAEEDRARGSTHVTSLYQQLQPSPKGLSRDEVAADQRRRLHGAMVEAVAANGYAGTSVDQIVGLAGVSTKALYRHFGSKQECFLATYDHVVAEGAARIATAYGMGSCEGENWSAGLLLAFDAFVEEIVARPKEARLALVEVLAAGPAVLERVQQSQLLFEDMIAQSLRHAHDGIELPSVLVEGIVHGIWHVARVLVMESRPESMRGLGAELLDWLLCYVSPTAEALSPSIARNGGVSATTETFGPEARTAVANQVAGPQHRTIGDHADPRMRALRAATRVAALEGYAALSLVRIAREAEVDLDALFEMFDDVEQCFLAALGLASAQLLARALEAAGSQPCKGSVGFASALERSLAAILDEIAKDPSLAQVTFVEVLHTGPSGARQRTTLLRRFADLVRRQAPISSRPSPLVADAIVGAIWGVIHDRVVRGQANTLPALSAHVAHLALAPLGGAETAVTASSG
ncbi:MAG: TetR/AcrR family transcriptional regulator [Solirubrobacteraceae bacterium]